MMIPQWKRDGALNGHADGMTQSAIAAAFDLSLGSVAGMIHRARLAGDDRARKRTPEEISEATKRALADPAVRLRRSEATKRALADPAVRLRISEATKRALADPAVRLRRSEAMKRARAAKGPVCPPNMRGYYRKLRAAGFCREAALAEVLRDVPPTGRAP